ncbi:glutamate receptor Gr2 [Capsaspora owczarzaki ATCC 30864]|uniref:Glutamate receptor Gr2 n=1 Tax=Capsaspora owczarzaki (strain ATCC 30864) TaxID=595528 RepID=A0A0D2WUD9_CAPO3|nr:glutamate receptor Gr2 [Capsaspora owczarzaki ATCC 30864]KJE95528.1 glutamate receptor Gr2 [Capsaspora owczarzaki ATCC 30864]|eukprot:XP_004345566.1 glutamate receptor Gr2 [Capsaspora owczarzaki ATCC 30864]
MSSDKTPLTPQYSQQQPSYPPPQQYAYPPPSYPAPQQQQQQQQAPQREASYMSSSSSDHQAYDISAAPPSYASATASSDVYHSNDPDLQEWKGIAAFDDSIVRRGFIRKVYSILTLQLLVALGFIALFLFNSSVKHYVQRNQAMLITAIILTFVLILAMACVEKIRRQTPYNYIFLGLFTLAESYLLGVTASYYDVDAVLIAVGITAFVTFGLTLFAFQTKWDFTGYGGYLFGALLVLICFGFMCIFIRGEIVRIVYAALGALIFSMYLVYDTQLMLGGTHKLALSPEEWVFAALNLYLDIINLFLFILSLVGNRR